MDTEHRGGGDAALSHIRIVELGDIPASYATRLLAISAPM